MCQVTRVLGRVLRLLRIGNSNNDLQLIFGTFIYALPSLFYVALLLLLIFFVWAVLGMNLLGRTALQVRKTPGWSRSWANCSLF